MANPSFPCRTASFRGGHTTNFPKAACWRQWLPLAAATSPSRAELWAQLNPSDKILGDLRRWPFAGRHPKLWVYFPFGRL